MAREDLKDEFLVDIRQKAIRLQDNGSLFTYKELVQEFGKPRKLMWEILEENLPKEEFNKFKRNFRWRASVFALAVFLLVSAIGTHTYVSNIRPIRELKTVIVNSENIMPSIDTFESRGDTVE